MLVLARGSEEPDHEDVCGGGREGRERAEDLR